MFQYPTTSTLSRTDGQSGKPAGRVSPSLEIHVSADTKPEPTAASTTCTLSKSHLGGGRQIVALDRQAGGLFPKRGVFEMIGYGHWLAMFAA